MKTTLPDGSAAGQSGADGELSDGIRLHMTERLLTPSKITAFLDCTHYLTLRHRVERGELKVEHRFGDMAQLLIDKGLAHERARLEQYQRDGKTVFVVSARNQHESFAGGWPGSATRWPTSMT